MKDYSILIVKGQTLILGGIGELLATSKSNLTTNQWIWVYYYIIEDMSIKEITTIEGVSAEAVKSWGGQAKKKLRKIGDGELVSVSSEFTLHLKSFKAEGTSPAWIYTISMGTILDVYLS